MSDITLAARQYVQGDSGSIKQFRRVRLGDICKIQNGFAFDSEYFRATEGTPLIRIRDLKTNNPSCVYQGEFDPVYVVTRGDLLVGMDGEFRAYRWNGPDALLNQRVCRLFPTEALSISYLHYALDEHLREIEEQTSFTTVKHLSSRDIADIDIPLPQYAEQERIATELTAALTVVDTARRAAQHRLTTVPVLPNIEARPDASIRVSSGVLNVGLEVWFGLRDNYVGIELYFWREPSTRVWEKLQAAPQQWNELIGDTWVFEQRGEQRLHTMSLYKEVAEIRRESSWPEAYRWFGEKLSLLYGRVAPRLKEEVDRQV